jgi:hypothetical protein
MRRTIVTAVVTAIVTLTTSASSYAGALANDTARFLAGMPLTPNSPLAKLTEEQSFHQHSIRFDSFFADLEHQQFEIIRGWSRAHLRSPRSTVYYFFSGPDFLYADAFFPNASTYVLNGLEAIGQIPDLTALPQDMVAQTLDNIERSLSTFFSASYFVTETMDSDLNKGAVQGVLPILFVFLARSGKTISDVSFVNLDRQGKLHSSDGRSFKNGATGVKIVFASDSGLLKTLFYFSTNVADQSNSREAFIQFCRQQAPGDSLLKSASYLLHEPKFSRVRNFILENSSLIVQDDSGVPIANFKASKWLLYPFGSYAHPLNIFRKYYQPKLVDLFQKKNPSPLDFGIGYHARYNKSNLLLAIKANGTTN